MQRRPLQRRTRSFTPQMAGRLRAQRRPVLGPPPPAWALTLKPVSQMPQSQLPLETLQGLGRKKRAHQEPVHSPEEWPGVLGRRGCQSSVWVRAQDRRILGLGPL